MRPLASSETYQDCLLRLPGVESWMICFLFISVRRSFRPQKVRTTMGDHLADLVLAEFHEDRPVKGTLPWERLGHADDRGEVGRESGEVPEIEGENFGHICFPGSCDMKAVVNTAAPNSKPMTA